MHSKETDVSVRGLSLRFLPVETRVPLKFGLETTTRVICARVRMSVAGLGGKTAEGWGETPLSVQWVWPSSLSYEEREGALRAFSIQLADAWVSFDKSGHPVELGHAFQEMELPALLKAFNESRRQAEPMPHLAALVCCSAFDIALHDAYGVMHQVPVYESYNPRYMNADLLLFPSKLENMPLVLLESMANGTPALVIREDGDRYRVPFSEVVEDNVIDLIADDEAGFRARLANVIANPQILDNLSANAQAQVREHYTWDQHLDCFEQHIDKLLGQAPHPAVS